MICSFTELTAAVRQDPHKRIMAIAAAEDEEVIDSALRAEEDGLVAPVYIGNAGKIRELLSRHDISPSACNILNAPEGKAAECAVGLVKDGSADILMKGMLESRTFLEPIVRKENGLRTEGLMSHAVLFGIPGYHKLLMTTDGGMVVYPSLDDKRQIIENANQVLHALGCENPKHAVLCATEKNNPKMIETVEAAELQKMNESGVIGGCVIVGPVSYDVAMSNEIAAKKGFDCPYVGDFDCLIMPNMQAGNILGKCFTVSLGAAMAGIVVGARVPVVMTSRGSDADEKYYSIALAAQMANKIKE